MQNFLLSPPADYPPLSKNLPRAFKQFKVPTVVTFSDNDELGHTTMETFLSTSLACSTMSPWLYLN